MQFRGNKGTDGQLPFLVARKVIVLMTFGLLLESFSLHGDVGSISGVLQERTDGSDFHSKLGN